ncbi:MAG: hypothetical protein OXG37_09790 [Actinomycetia bacterium]|nr:hypothetical protein [Actinomycetes bacterium]
MLQQQQQDKKAGPAVAARERYRRAAVSVGGTIKLGAADYAEHACAAGVKTTPSQVLEGVERDMVSGRWPPDATAESIAGYYHPAVEAPRQQTACGFPGMADGATRDGRPLPARGVRSEAAP